MAGLILTLLNMNLSFRRTTGQQTLTEHIMLIIKKNFLVYNKLNMLHCSYSYTLKNKLQLIAWAMATTIIITFPLHEKDSLVCPPKVFQVQEVRLEMLEWFQITY